MQAAKHSSIQLLEIFLEVLALYSNDDSSLIDFFCNYYFLALSEAKFLRRSSKNPFVLKVARDAIEMLQDLTK